MSVFNSVLSMKRLTLAVFFLVPMIAHDATKWECGERSNLPQEGKNYCAAGDFRQSEKKLRKLVDSLLQKHMVTFGDAIDLSNAQSAFESYREHQCAAETKRIEDMPFHPMILSQCKSRLSNLRIKELKRMRQKIK